MPPSPPRAAARGGSPSGRPSLRRQAWSRGPQPPLRRGRSKKGMRPCKRRAPAMRRIPYPGTSLKNGRFMTARYKQAKTVQPGLACGRCPASTSSARTGITSHPSFPRRRESKGFSSAQHLNNARWIPAFAGMTTFFCLPGSGTQVGSDAATISPASGRGNKIAPPGFDAIAL